MSISITCASAQEQLTHIKSLEQKLGELFVEIQKPEISSKERTEAIEKMRRIKRILEREIIALQEQVNPFERLFNLKEQYKNQIDMLETAKILETKEINGEEVRGITDIEGDFHQVPTLKEVISRLREKKELLTLKQTQGFGKIRLIPFGMSLDVLIEKYKQVLVDHAKSGKLFTARKDLNEKQILRNLNFDDPIYISPEYSNADKNGTLVYFVSSLIPENHGGYTKSEILRHRRDKHKSGWDILILENNVNIPREGKGKIVNGRKQIETNKSSEKYLQLLQTPEYRGETGLTPEENLIYSITELVENNEIVDDWQKNGSSCYNIAAYSPVGPIWAERGIVLCSHFSHQGRQAFLSRTIPTSVDLNSGIRSAVRV